MITHDEFMIYSKIVENGGDIKRSVLKAYCDEQKLGDFDGILEQLSKAKLIIALYSYIRAIDSLANKSFLNTNKNNNKSYKAKESSKLIKASAKMANFNYRSVVKGTSMRPNKNQKAIQNLSRQDIGDYWLGLIEKNG
tara:strand:+ start:105 stop:518 length:414 start_codon:yes stop_codon:yes gene_type:complete